MTDWFKRTPPSRLTPQSLNHHRQLVTMENGNASQEGKDPSSFLSDIIGNPVTVKLNSGVVYKGIPPVPTFAVACH
jgi:hypothetical protein